LTQPPWGARVSRICAKRRFVVDAIVREIPKLLLTLVVPESRLVAPESRLIPRRKAKAAKGDGMQRSTGNHEPVPGGD
jgi:hypothetical protein